MSTPASIKKIPVSQLRPGMYIHDLNCAWMDHPFVTNSFSVKDVKRVQDIAALGIHDVYIDTERGDDVIDAITQEEAQHETEVRLEAIAHEPPQEIHPVPLGAEIERARRLHTDANRIVRGMLHDIRLGKQV